MDDSRGQSRAQEREAEIEAAGGDPKTEIGWTKQELMDAGGMSASSFDNIRKTARVRGPQHGGLRWVFSAEEVLMMVLRAESGRFSETGGIPAAAWRKLLAARGIVGPDVKKLRGRGGGQGRSR